MDVKPQDMDEILNQKIVDDIFKNENKGILTIKTKNYGEKIICNCAFRMRSF